MDRALERAIDRMLEQLGEAVEALQHDELDVELMPGKLTIDCGNGVRLVLSRQSATGQIWLAEPGGGWHFDLKDGAWICDKRGVELTDALQKVLAAQLGQPVDLGHA
jgi:CyaY protein